MINYRLLPGLKKMVILREILSTFRSEDMHREFATMAKTEEDMEKVLWMEQHCPHMVMEDWIERVKFKAVVLEHAAWTKKETERAMALRNDWFKVAYGLLRWLQDPEVREVRAEEDRMARLQASEVWGIDLPGGLGAITAYGRTLGSGPAPRHPEVEPGSTQEHGSPADGHPDQDPGYAGEDGTPA